MWISLGRLPAASGRDQPNHCTSIRCHLPAAGATGALAWFIRAQFWTPAYQIKQKNIKRSSPEQSLLHNLAFITYSFQYHGKICRTISACWETLIWKDNVPESEIITDVKLLDKTSRCFLTVEVLMCGQRKGERIAQPLQYLHTDWTPFKICME